MDYGDALDALSFASRYDDTLTFGGGEPTLHPRFWDILRSALWTFDYVWFASNGSKRKTMMRLAAILDNGYDEFCPEDDEPIQLSREDQLTVALSTDHFHNRDMVNDEVWDHWHRRAGLGYRGATGYELRNVTQQMDGVAGVGRAKKTGSGWADRCVCSDNIIRPDGSIKLCGCPSSPIIGSVRMGITDEWQKKMLRLERYQDTKCYKAFQRRIHELDRAERINH